MPWGTKDTTFDRDHFPLLLRSLLDRGAALQPENLIITHTSKGYTQITYAEHQTNVKRLASALDKWGVHIGDCVGTMMWNSHQHLQCYHALTCMGAILHTLNLRLSPKDLTYIIGHAKDRVIISDADLLPKLAMCELGCVELFLCCGTDWVEGNYTLPEQIPKEKAQSFDKFVAGGGLDFVWPDIPEDSLCALCYTSGTTGNPKGAAYSHRSTYIHTLMASGADQIGVRGRDTVLPFVPMFHVLSWGVPFSCLMLGTRMVFNGNRMDPQTLLDCMMDWKVEISTGVPTVWQGVRACIEKQGVDKVKEKLNLRLLTCGGSAPPPEMMQWFLDKLGVEFLQGWGMTETNPLGALARFQYKHKDIGKSPAELFNNITKCGLPCPGVEMKIVDADNMDVEKKQGELGELLVRGPWIITEYFRVDAKDKFHKGWLITGDVAKIDEEGAMIIGDRSKDVIKSGGEWISSIDLENHIAAMSEVVGCAVVAMPHPRWDERPLAVVVLAEGTPEEGLHDKVKEHCLKDFAKFQLPDDTVVWKEIPLTSTGKIDKKVIREKLKTSGYVLPTAK